MGSAPRCSGCFSLNARTGKKNALGPQVCGSAWFIAVLLSDRPPFLSPALPTTKMCDTTSCVGVGRLSTRNPSVKKHHCHNRRSIYFIYINVLANNVLGKWPVNKGLLDRTSNPARHKRLCPPHAHRIRTSRPQVVRGNGARGAAR